MLLTSLTTDAETGWLVGTEKPHLNTINTKINSKRIQESNKSNETKKTAQQNFSSR